MKMSLRVALSLLGLITAASQAASPVATERFALPGLEKPANILIDKWGVPHIYANTFYDAFYVQGFMAARDRLWQIDLWRKRGLGLMAQDFGPAYVDGDRMARTVMFRGDMYREWLAYGSDSKRVAEAFVAGINAYVGQTELRPELLPPEFKKLDYKPARWQAQDIVRIRHHGLTSNFIGEALRASAMCNAKEESGRVDWLRRELDPPVTPVVPEGLDLCSIPLNDIIKSYDLATASPRFPKEVWAGKIASGTTGGDLYVRRLAGGEIDDSTGSNNWAISGARTSTGRPILANDPHRAHGAPGLRYISHLNAPGLSVIGAGEPFLPGISIGHNGTVGFGLTRFYIDQEDLYAYELNPAQAQEYKYRDRWEAMQTVTEEISVRGEATPRKVTINFTRHGPLIHTDPKTNRAWSLRAAWLDVGMAPYFGSMDYMRAQDWNQFSAALNRWGAPGINHVYADRAGNIGWEPRGLTPIRPNWDGLLPVPGDGRYEWQGYRNMDELPSAYNPAAGYLQTANENNIPPDHPSAKLHVGYEWADRSRSRRLQHLIGSNKRSSLADSMAWQNDMMSIPAQRVVATLIGLDSADPKVRGALDLLRGWDGRVLAESPAAALFETWFSKHLRPAVVSAGLSPEQAKVVGAGDASRVLDVLDGKMSWLTVERRNEVILASLKTAVAEVEARLGPDMKAWQWGNLHRAVFTHPLNQNLDAAARGQFNVDAGAIGGSAYTLMNANYRNSDFQLTTGASFRMVLDIGNWDASRAINAPGQSGNPASPHYRDLAPMWAKGQYFPLLFSRKAVERDARQRLELVPK
ncbi:MAG: penicillin acylase family protein [Pseudomonadota bacterium]